MIHRWNTGLRTFRTILWYLSLWSICGYYGVKTCWYCSLGGAGERSESEGVKPPPPFGPSSPVGRNYYLIIQFILFTISFIVVSKSFSIGRLNHDAWMCHQPPNSDAIFEMSVFFDLIEHLIVSHSFLIVIVIFGHLISWMTVSQYHACSLSIQWSFNSSIS